VRGAIRGSAHEDNALSRQVGTVKTLADMVTLCSSYLIVNGGPIVLVHFDEAKNIWWRANLVDDTSAPLIHEIDEWPAMRKVITDDTGNSNSYLPYHGFQLPTVGQRLAELRSIVREGIEPPSGSAATLSLT
jgi:hypothetical protein